MAWPHLSSIEWDTVSADIRRMEKKKRKFANSEIFNLEANFVELKIKAGRPFGNQLALNN